MGRNLASLLAGLLFGFGLALSGMTHPQKVLGFLDVAGAWDASLLFVLGGAVGVTLVSFRFILRLGKPLLVERFIITKETHIDRPIAYIERCKHIDGKTASVVALHNSVS